MDKSAYTLNGTDAPWYDGWDLSDNIRAKYRDMSKKSQKIKAESLKNNIEHHPINTPNLDPNDLMPQCKNNQITALSLFSGGGGIDLGFARAGFTHAASFELLDFAADTLRNNRPMWKIYSGEDGDVTLRSWKEYCGEVDVVHGGPPCQPYSTAGKRRGKEDVRDMVPEFVRAIMKIKPTVFVMENVPGITSKKFQCHLEKNFYASIRGDYHIKEFWQNAASFGVPQIRRRRFFIGFKDKQLYSEYKVPEPTHIYDYLYNENSGQERLDDAVFSEEEKLRCLGAREALGLCNIGYDALAPTLRSGLTGPRHTTSILSSTNAKKEWEKLRIWPNGVQYTRKEASVFPAKDNHFRLSVPDCGLLQGFPEDWSFSRPVYKAIGQIGNSVAPPVAYWIARSIRDIIQ